MSRDRNSGIVAGGRNANGTFAKGNPGRPKGTRLRVTRAVEDLMDGQAEAITQKAVDMALEGDATALRLCIERIAPARKDAPVQFDLPKMTSAEEAAEGTAAVLQAVAEGDLTPVEGATVMALVEQFRRVLEASEFEARIKALEERT